MHPADGQMNGLYVSIAVCNRMATDIVGPNGPFRRWVNGDEWSGLRLKIQKHLFEDAGVGIAGCMGGGGEEIVVTERCLCPGGKV